MPLEKITIENFKGIKDPVTIDLKPITLLFGKNSAGKSSIIQALDYARHIFINNDLNPIHNNLEKNSPDLGGFENIVHNHDLSKTIIFHFHLSFSEMSFIDFASPFLKTNSNFKLNDLSHEATMRYIKSGESELMQLVNRIKKAVVKIAIRWNEQKSKPYIELYQLNANGSPLFQVYREASNEPFVLLSFHENPVLPQYLLDAFNRVGESVEEVLTMYEEQRKSFEEFMERYEKGEITEQQWKIVLKQTAEEEERSKKWSEYIDHDYRTGKELIWDELIQKSDFPDTEGTVIFKYPWGWWNEKHLKPDDHSYFQDLISAYLSIPINALGIIFDLTTHIGPLREIPTRDHVQLNKNHFRRWLTGIASYDVLLDTETPRELIDLINDWLSSKNHFNTGYKLDIKRYKKLDIDSKLMDILQSSPNLNSDSAEIRKAIDDLPEMSSFKIWDISRETKLSIQDIGTGISQILPIIVGVLYLQKYLLSIEQPELHIHPAMQAEMGDLFIDKRNDAPILLIETHSEHLMLRILRRIRETKENENRKYTLYPEDVAVYYVVNDRKATDAIHIPITEDGEFLLPWPHGFFPERAKELFS